MFQCVDLNECLSNPCGSGARCINEYGGFSCECPPGARGDPYTNCGSLDQCQNNPCGLNARCFNDGGSYRCECPQGFEGNPTQQCRGEKLGVRSGLCLIETFCSDVNECLRNPCGSNAECTNTEGSYQVYIIALLFLISIEPIALITLFQCSCKAGLTGDPFTGCSDTDECSAAQGNPCGGNINTWTSPQSDTHNYLPANAVCRNTNPGYKCDCPPGFTGNGNVACEATEVRTLCKSNFDCTNNAKCQQGQCVCR